MKRCKGWRMLLCLFLQPFVASPMSQLILQTFCHITHVTAHSTTLALLHLRHRHFTYVTWPAAHEALPHSPTVPSLQLRHSSFSNPSVASPMSQLILQPFRCFTYVATHSTTLPSLHLRRNSFYNPSVASPTSQLIVQPFRRFTYVTVHSPTLLSLLLRHKLFT